jgi:hypothetical protein
MTQTIPFKGEVLLTEKLVIPFKDTIKIPKGRHCSKDSVSCISPACLV